MDRSCISRAAQILYDARVQRMRLEKLPDDCAPRTKADGYEIQNALVCMMGDQIIGWKIGCITAESQQRSHTDEPFSGPILRKDVLRNRSSIAPESYFDCALQAEFALTLSNDFLASDAPFSLAVVRDRVKNVIPALENADSRFFDSKKLTAPSLIADGAKAGVLILGDKETDFTKVDLISHTVRLYANDKMVAKGSGANVLGNPLESLRWFVNSMAARGHDVPAGHFVSTGSCTGSYQGTLGERIVADFGALGRVQVELAPA